MAPAQALAASERGVGDRALQHDIRGRGDNRRFVDDVAHAGRARVLELAQAGSEVVQRDLDLAVLVGQRGPVVRAGRVRLDEQELPVRLRRLDGDS